MSGKRLLAGALASLVAVTLAACGSTTVQEAASVEKTAEVSPEAATNPADTLVGKSMAELPMQVETNDGTATDLAAIADGKPLVVNFWATWCYYSMDEMPEFQRIVAEYGDRVSFAFIDQTDGKRETVEGVRAFVDENGMQDLPIYYDPVDDSMSVFGVASIPVTIVFDSEGRIVEYRDGVIDAGQMRALLDTLA
jgi:thiol-disulfide isomerase/thioredoxin